MTENEEYDPPVEAVGDEEVSERTNPNNRLQSFEECRAAIDDLYRRAVLANGAEGFYEFLEFIKRFSHMAVFNAMMVLIQRPGSMLAASVKQWAKVGRCPLPDAVPIVILRPFGPLGFVYDVEDTNGAPLHEDGRNPFRVVGNVSDSTLNRMMKASASNGVYVEQTFQYGTGLAGTAAGLAIHPEVRRDGEFWWRVRINANHSVALQIATLAHELGHVYCGHLSGHPKGHWPSRPGLTLEQREVEAEAVSWLVCTRMGLEPNSPDYLHGLVDSVARDELSMYALMAAVNRVEASVVLRRAS